MTRFSEVLRVLAEGSVEFIVVGGVAATAHGSARSTQDIDVVYARNRGNLERLVVTLAPHEPYLRGAPPGLPFRFDYETLKSGLNFTLVTDLGAIDLLGEITGGGSYEDILPESKVVEVFGVRCQVLGIDALIRTKRAAGRPKDFEPVAELELIRQRRARESGE